jgi:hypothetical protein
LPQISQYYQQLKVLVPSVEIDRQKVVGGNAGGLQTGYQDPFLEGSTLILSATASIRTLA